MNRMKNYIIKAVLLITIIALVIAIIGRNVYATKYTGIDKLKASNAKLGDKVDIQGSTLREREDIYCFEHKGNFLGGEYKITDIIEIDGQKATSASAKKSVSKEENIVMSYIISKGNYRKNMYQYNNSVLMSGRNIAIWAYQYTWMNALGLDFFNKNCVILS